MASSTPTTIVSTKQRTNYARLCRLLVDVGSLVLRETFDSMRPPGNLHIVLSSPPVHDVLQSLRKESVLNSLQWNKLYPAIPSSVSSESFDITLLTVLLRNICSLVPPATGWNSLPPAMDKTIDADIARLMFYTIKVYGYGAAIDDGTFSRYWKNIRDTLLRLGGVGYQVAINHLRYERMDPKIEERYQERLKHWVKNEVSINERLEELEKGIRKVNEMSKREVKAGIPSDDELEKLAVDVAYMWMRLGRRLDIAQTELDEFHEECEKLPEAVYRMLMLWKQRGGSAATYQVLHEALCDPFISRRDLAEKFCEFEGLSSSFASIPTAAFLRALEFGKTCDKRVKVSIIGPDRVGKTSLGKSLTGAPFNDKEPSTDGVQMSPSIKNAGTKAWKNLPSHQNTTAFDHKCAEIVKEEQNRSAEPQRSDTVTSSQAPNQRKAQELIVNEDVTQDDEETTPKIEGEKNSDPPEKKTTLGEDVVKSRFEQIAKLLEEHHESEGIWPVIWDFAGQDVYHTIHPVFMSPEAIYLLVVDLTKELSDRAQSFVKVDGHEEETVPSPESEDTNLDRIIRWMTLVHYIKQSEISMANTTPPRRSVILVGTKADIVEGDPMNKMTLFAENIFVNSPPLLLKHITEDRFVVDNTRNGTSSDERNQEQGNQEIENLRAKILEIADNMPHTKKPIPLQWLSVELEIQEKRRKNVPYVSKKEFRHDIAEKCCTRNEDEDVEGLLHFLHARGTIIYHASPEDPDGLVVLDPKWLIETICKIITATPNRTYLPEYMHHYDSLRVTGILSNELLDLACKKLRIDGIKSGFIFIMKKFNLIFEWKSKGGNLIYLVPSMVTQSTDVDLGTGCGPAPLCLRFDEIGYVPCGLFTRLVVLFGIWASEQCTAKQPDLYYNVASFFVGEKYILHLVCYSSIIKLYVSTEDAPDQMEMNAFCVMILRRLTECLKKLQKDCPWLKAIPLKLYARCELCSTSGSKQCVRHSKRECCHDDCAHYIDLEKKPFVCEKKRRRLPSCLKDKCTPWIEAIEAMKSKEPRCTSDEGQGSSVKPKRTCPAEGSSEGQGTCLMQKRKLSSGSSNENLKGSSEGQGTCLMQKRKLSSGSSNENLKGTAPMTGQDDNTCKVPPQLSVNLPNCSDINAPFKKWSEVSLPVDILLLTVKDCEFSSCYSHLQNCFKSYLKELGYVYFGEIGKLKVALVKHQESSTAPGGSIFAARNAITRLRPKAVFSVGTCSSLSPAKANLGDVVILTKLVTYAHKTITEEGVQDRGIKAPVSRDFSRLIAHAADGWKAPLRDPNKHEVKVHRDCVMLSGPELVSAKKRCEELIRTYPDATAIEMDGEGLYTAAYDLKMEWVVIKGISGYADGTTTSEGWEKFASAIAASIVANILRDSSVFQEWRHYGHEDGFHPTGLIDAIRRQYISSEGRLEPFPWCEDFNFSLNDIFTRLKIVSRKKTRSLLTDHIVNMTAIFRRHDECEKPRTVLIEGKPGMGKTTYCQKLAYDWATGKQKPDDCFPDFKVLLLLKCRDVIKGHDLWETIADQLLPQGNTYKETREKFFKYIRDNQSKVLLVLDGLDELPKSKRAIFTEIIRGKELPNCHIVATARHGTGIRMRKYCDTLLEIVGFIPDDIRNFIERYFKNTDGESGGELISRLFTDAEDEVQKPVYRSLIEMMANPLNAALVCFVWEDLKSELPRLTETTLFVNIVECVLRRFVQRKGLSSNSDDFIDIYKVQLKHLGSIALNKLKKDCLDFQESELGPEAGVISEFGFLSVQPGGSKMRPRRYYGFQHKTFQEFFAAFYLSCLILDANINLETLVNDIRYFNELKQVLLFSVGLIATKCKETALRLVKSILSQIGSSQAREEQELETNEKRITCALQCLGDHIYEETNFQNLFENDSSNSVSGLLAKALNLTTTLTELDLSPVNIGDAGAHVLSETLKVNTTLKLLDLLRNSIGRAGGCALAESLKFNITLTELNLVGNNIDDAAAFAFAESLEVNTSLTKLDLSHNYIGEAGAFVFAESLKVNTSLTKLDLSLNIIGCAGGRAFAELLELNTSLTKLGVDQNNIVEAGGCALAESLKVNTSLTSLSLHCNFIGEAGACALAESLKVNTSLTRLGLHDVNIGEAGACALAESLEVNTSLKTLRLDYNNIGEAGGCALAESLKVNTSLTKLSLRTNDIGEAGACALAESLKVNTSLTLARY